MQSRTSLKGKTMFASLAHLLIEATLVVGLVAALLVFYVLLLAAARLVFNLKNIGVPYPYPDPGFFVMWLGVTGALLCIDGALYAFDPALFSILWR